MNVWRSGFVSYAAAGLAGLAVAGGCTKRQSTMGPAPEMNPAPKVQADAGARADELRNRSRKFDETVQQLPGRTPEEHRRAMQQVFTELSQILPVLYGPSPSGVFRQQLRVVESARTQLATGPQGLAVEPTIDTGLRAARDALAGLSSKSYFDRAQVGKTLDRLNKALDALDTNRGAMHQTAVAESVGLMSQAIREMSDTLNQRLDDSAATAKPAPDEPAAPKEPAPDAAKPDTANPDAAAPDTAKPDAAAPDAAAPDAPKADEPKADEPKADEPKPDAAAEGDKDAAEGAGEAPDPDKN
jgi:hypothetical protein